MLATNRVTLFGDRRFEVVFELLGRVFVATDEPAAERVVCDVSRQCLDVGEVDERSLFLLEASR
ncbi:hypothetical protein [Salinigranum halophilum]|uniref:hypothetical protein n=1 Tax=Salinigranum halophilum TaxID=2565931 RepID=UPI001F240B9C|nr:hypothetical protein [Salinigranum halophilum]